MFNSKTKATNGKLVALENNPIRINCTQNEKLPPYHITRFLNQVLDNLENILCGAKEKREANYG